MRSFRGLIVVAGLAFVTPACVPEAPPQNSSQPDAAAETPDAAPPPPDAAPPPADATPLCENATAYPAGSRHGNLDEGLGGTGCNGECHTGSDVGILGRELTIAGRLYNRREVEPAQPVAGAYIYAVDQNGQVIEMVTDSVGKFWYDGEVAFPVKTWASGCPDSIPMVDPSAGNCNMGGCHGADNKIYLPNPLDPPPPSP